MSGVFRSDNPLDVHHSTDVLEWLLGSGDRRDFDVDDVPDQGKPTMGKDLDPMDLISLLPLIRDLHDAMMVMSSRCGRGPRGRGFLPL